MPTEQGVAAVERALSLLDAFAEEDSELTLADLSERTGLYKSTVLRLAKSLEKFGYLHRSESGVYRLGCKLLHLGSMYQRHFHTAEIVPGVLKQIVSELQEGASFYVRDGDKRVCLHRVEALRSVRDSVHEGDLLPLNVGAAGHVIRAFTGSMGQKSEEVRRAMYAASFGERDPEIGAVACPVFSRHQQLVGALAVSGPRYRIEALGVDPILDVLFKYGRQLTTVFGGNPDALVREPQPREPRRPRVARVR